MNVIIIHKIIPHPPIKTTVCPPVSHAVVQHRQLRKWRPHLQAPLPSNHWRNIDSQKGTWESYRPVHCCSDGECHHGRLRTEADFRSMLTISLLKRKHCSLYLYREKMMFDPALHTWTMQLMDLSHVDRMLADFDLAACFQNC